MTTSNLQTNRQVEADDYQIQVEKFEEEKIWKDFKMGEESAFIAIYRQYFQTLINYGNQFFENKSEAEDFVQDVFIDLRLKRKKLKTLRGSIKVFLMVCLKNKILDFKRKEDTRDKNLTSYAKNFEFVFPHEDQLIRTQEYEWNVKKLKMALKTLTSRQREAIYYLYYENLSYQEIKTLMRFDNVKSVRNLVYKACQSMKVKI